MEPRFLNFVGSTGKAKKVVRNGRACTEVPVIALVEGAIRAMNAKDYELVTAECFGEDPAQWDGMPIQPGHPIEDGVPVSAKLPKFAALSFGYLEGTTATDKKLRTLAVIDDEKANANPASADVLARIDAGKPVEVSVGAYVAVRACEGEKNGRKHKVAWSKIKADHLAMLSAKQTGACSIEMGCGALRANAMHEDGTFEELNEMEFRAAYDPNQPRDEDGRWTDGAIVRIDPKGSLKHPLSRKVGSITQVAPSGNFFGVSRKGKFVGYFHQSDLQMTDLQARIDDDATDPVEFIGLRAAMPAGWNDNDVREALIKAIRDKEAGTYAWPVAVYSDYVVYQMEERGPAPDYRYTTKMYRRDFTFDKEAKAYSLGDVRKEVEPVMTYEVLSAPAGIVQAETKPPCGCGGHKPVTAASAAGEKNMDRSVRIAALVANPHNPVKELKMLEAASEESLKALEDAAAAAKKTADDLRVAQEAATAAEGKAVANATALTALQGEFKALESSAKPLIQAAEAAAQKEKDELVGKLKACTAGILTEEQLKAKPVEELRTLASIAKVDVAVSAPSYAAAGMPRFASEGTDITKFSAPDPYKDLMPAAK